MRFHWASGLMVLHICAKREQNIGCKSCRRFSIATCCYDHRSIGAVWCKQIPLPCGIHHLPILAGTLHILYTWHKTCSKLKQFSMWPVTENIYLFNNNLLPISIVELTIPLEKHSEFGKTIPNIRQKCSVRKQHIYTWWNKFLYWNRPSIYIRCHSW